MTTRNGRRTRTTRMVLVALLLASHAGGSDAAETPAEAAARDLSDPSLEGFMQIEVPTVYGASKREQKTTEAPSSDAVAQDSRTFRVKLVYRF